MFHHVILGKPSVSRGALLKWRLQLYGSPMTAQEVQERKRLDF